VGENHNSTICWQCVQSVLSVQILTLILTVEAFAATGWRVGWLIGPPAIIKYVLAATTRIVFTTNTPLQEAAAGGLEQAAERKFFENQTEEYTERRAAIVEAFERLGLPYTIPEGSYFALLVRSFLHCCDPHPNI
jgi:kynurenine aminotransferase